MKTFALIWLAFFCSVATAQDSLPKKQILSFSGYIKELVWLRSDKGFQNSYVTNLLHNRMNIKWKYAKVSGSAELRNRLYWGDDVRVIPYFKRSLNNQNEAMNLSANWISTNNAVMHTNVERLWMEFRRPKWNIRAGRQRINWGITNTWNPNDLFNTYNFLDFDYEERPGSDAVKFQYLSGDFSNYELAMAATGNKPLLAVKYFTNFKKYDLQFIAGVYDDNWTAGVGWAGSMKNVGFKGEWQWFGDSNDSASAFNATIEGDYIFENGWYLASAVLYNQKGWHRPLLNGTNLIFQASPRNVMPGRWSWLLNASKEFTPLFSGRMNLVFSPGIKMLIFFPSFTYSLKTNFDLDFIWQSFFVETDKLESLSNTGFLRLKLSF